MADLAQLWLAGLYVVTFAVAIVGFLWYERVHRDRPFLPPPPGHSEAEATAMEALLTMRGLIHQLGNNAHELALQFELVMSTTDEVQQQQIRDRLRIALHRFTEITHQVSQVDARLTGYVSPGTSTTERPPHL